jgi:uncharacterized protein (TIGR00296 family)
MILSRRNYAAPVYSDEDGELAVRLARASIDRVVRGVRMPELELPDIFNRDSGAFVTLKTFPGHQLRGCIGYPEPYFPLKASLVKGAEGATRDPRFPRLAEEEVENVVVEVSLLTPPELIKVKSPKDYLAEVVVGRDGLIVEQGVFKGLLLPQVPVEWNWDSETFLGQTCVKAGLYPDAWLDAGTKIYRFTAEVFGEEEPRGRVKRMMLDG